MSKKSHKVPTTNNVIEELQIAMCSLLYATLVDKMNSSQTSQINGTLDQYQIQLSVYNGERILYFSCKNKEGRTIANPTELNFKNATTRDPIFSWITSNTSTFPNRVQTYEQWIDSVSKCIDDLIKVEKQYETLVNKIYDMPIFSVGRFVIIEKYKSK